MHKRILFLAALAFLKYEFDLLTEDVALNTTSARSSTSLCPCEVCSKRLRPSFGRRSASFRHWTPE